MALNLNPLNIAGPNHPGNVVQSDVRIPAAHPLVASYRVGSNVLNLTWPIPKYQQPGT
jgi:hypothetical protein